MLSDAGFKSIGVVGLGLIGGSFAKAFAVRGLSVYGYDTHAQTLIEAAESEVFEGVTDELNAFLGFTPDLIYVCLPVKAAAEFMAQLGECGWVNPVTDAGSVKVPIENAANVAQLNFCGGHPIKGKETSGFGSSEAELFEGAHHILTGSCELAVKLKTLHEGIGMKVSSMSAAEHDKVFAHISHLPHVAAFSLVETVSAHCENALGYAGGGFKDFTRIAASDPVMWADIFCDNAEELLESIDGLEKTIASWKKLILENNHAELKERIEKISAIRRKL